MHMPNNITNFPKIQNALIKIQCSQITCLEDLHKAVRLNELKLNSRQVALLFQSVHNTLRLVLEQMHQQLKEGVAEVPESLLETHAVLDQIHAHLAEGTVQMAADRKLLLEEDFSKPRSPRPS